MSRRWSRQKYIVKCHIIQSLCAYVASQWLTMIDHVHVAIEHASLVRGVDREIPDDRSN